MIKIQVYSILKITGNFRLKLKPKLEISNDRYFNFTSVIYEGKL